MQAIKLNFFQNTSISSVNLVKLPHHFEDNGDLVVIEGMLNVPFDISRVFFVRAEQGAVRGKHAHKACAQFLTCTRGSVQVKCTDGIQSAVFELNHPNIGLFLPPGIWAEQRYLQNDSALTVLCDRIYESDDYIREFTDFLMYRQSLVQSSEFGKRVQI